MSMDVVTVGHALVDIRITVEDFAGPDEESRINNQSRGIGGSAVNVAVDIAKLGGKSGIIAKIGFDSFGKIIFDELSKLGIDISGLRISIGDTGFSIVVINKRGEIAIYSYKGVSDSLRPEEVNSDIISRARIIHIASLRLDTTLKATKTAKSHGKTVSWDPGRVVSKAGLNNVENILANIDIVFLNWHESEALTGTRDLEKASRLISEKGPSIIVIKLGDKGAFIYNRGNTRRIPAFKPPKIVDTTGAGDALAAGMLFKLARGHDVHDALIYGMAVASLKITMLGANSIPEPSRVEKYLEQLRMM
ncbi:MAG: carbohydrate kinase family protein [Desulfurococcales archaeon]|nr:carbohydrate kinase family protein [Desulfurococcales archaeon]